MKKLSLCAAVLLLCLPMAASAQETDYSYYTKYAVKVILNGEEMDFTPPAIAVNDNTMVPFRQLFEAYGAEVIWQPGTKTITATKDGTTIKITIDSQTAYVNDEEVKLTQSPFTSKYKDGNMYTFVNLRFISEALGAVVTFTKEPVPTVYIQHWD
ncbi:copper amine oxidase N-terminal domain-containing protein [Thermobacillus sp.]|uniref:copper amine oxidase N-terminal domain-containing protein n=1 Tax=Thermobacillus sp. TaxID=2108467 RepID=UPI00257E9BFB|nr:copper amine oxidase N-terminal domain-containing protein [Thermobacillus sp.]